MSKRRLSTRLLVTTILIFSSNIQAFSFDVTDKYIVTLKQGIDLTQHLLHVNELHRNLSGDSDDFKGVLEDYTIGDEYRGYAGHFNHTVASRLKAHADVASVEADRIWTEADLTIDEEPCQNACEPGKSCSGLDDADISDAGRGPSMIRQNQAPYNLALISNRGLTSKTYWYHRSAGAGTYAYVIDGGINAAHAEFGGRASLGFNACPSDPRIPVDDTTGHGTFVAGVIGGRKFGVAKACNIIAIKATHKGRADTVVLMRALQWVARDIVVKRREAKSVAIMALTLRGVSEGIDRAISSAFNRGMVTVTAAWDRGEDASLESPAGAEDAITVGSTDRQRRRATSSNWGRSVDIFAPGVGICAAGGAGNRGIVRRSGTSGAAAHVAGIVVYLRSFLKLSDYARVTRAHVQKLAFKGLVGDAKGSSDLFAYNGSGR